MKPEENPENEFWKGLQKPTKECLTAGPINVEEAMNEPDDDEDRYLKAVHENLKAVFEKDPVSAFSVNILRYCNNDQMRFLRDWLSTYLEEKTS